MDSTLVTLIIFLVVACLLVIAISMDMRRRGEYLRKREEINEELLHALSVSRNETAQLQKKLQFIAKAAKEELGPPTDRSPTSDDR